MEDLSEHKYLPYSSGYYKLTRHGDILDINDNVLKIELNNNKKYVFLNWIDGEKNYELGCVIAITSWNIKIPTHLWKFIEPIYKDNNSLNTNISNISYRFSCGQLEAYGHKGFYYIPFYTEYAISPSGDLLNLKRLKIHSWSPSKPVLKKNITGGYMITRAVCDNNNLFVISRHRAIGLAFLRYETNPSKLVINHKDGIPGNDSINNLEWVTRAKNNQHAYDSGLMVNKTIKILMKNLNTNTIEKFISISECVRKINRSEGFIRNRLFKTSHIRYSDGLVFKLDNGSDWPILQDSITTGVETKDIIARDIFTGKIYIFNNAAEAASYFKLSREIILRDATDEVIRAINGYNFRFLSDKIKWPSHSEKHLRIYKKYPKNTLDGVIVKNLEDREIEFFESAELASKIYNITPGAIKRYCREHKTINGNTFYFYKLEENLGPPIE